MSASESVEISAFTALNDGCLQTDHLPQEVWLHAFCFLSSVCDLGAVASVSKHFNHLMNQDSVWRNMFGQCWKEIPKRTGNSEVSWKKLFRSNHQARRNLLINMFADSPSVAIRSMIEERIIGRDSPEAIGRFLRRENKGLVKHSLVNFLCDPEKEPILKAYTKTFDLKELELDVAFRKFLETIAFPFSATQQVILIEFFAKRYFECNPYNFKSSDVVAALVSALLVLNITFHNPKVDRKLSLHEFKESMKEINNGESIDKELLTRFYSRTKETQFKDGTKREEKETSPGVISRIMKPFRDILK
eukprot:TRINITY_DN22959_c0_g1_i1.p1 TRINITY_DN22959_c0_g1~~TRINITY_DN22959_c0_g1_i1.p1  ORF type:complete len:304 (-),score=44.73 TRINITY_DN22959_c0_g1_i1:22-933(-)